MARLYLLCCLVALFSSALSDTAFSETGATGRGPRPVEAGQQGECKSQKEWPFCSDEDWGPKCPSGCRIEGLMNEADRDLQKKIDNIRKILEDNRNRYKNTRQTTENVYGLIREKLILDTGNDDKYGKLADDLRRRIVDLRVKILNNLERLATLKNSIRQQVNEMNALEVDIDIKIRACKGSCANAASYNVDRESYVNLDKQLTQLDTLIVQRTESSSGMRTLKMRRVDKEVTVPEHYKLRLSKDEEGSDIKDIVQYQMSLERLESDTKLGSTDKFSGPGLSVCKIARQQPGNLKSAGHDCSEKGRPLCADDDWGMMCPSGCRLEGLINREAKNFLDKVNAMCHLMERIRQKATDLTKDSQQSYAAARKYVVQNYVTNTKYFEMAEELQSRLTSLKQRAANLATKLRAQHGIIREQVQLMLQIEVDLDIKMRSCQGSCERAATYSINMATYEVLEQQLLQVDKLSETNKKSESTPVTLQRRTEQSLPTSYKTLASRRPDGVVYFEDVELLSLFLEKEKSN